MLIHRSHQSETLQNLMDEGCCLPGPSQSSKTHLLIHSALSEAASGPDHQGVTYLIGESDHLSQRSGTTHSREVAAMIGQMGMF